MPVFRYFLSEAEAAKDDLRNCEHIAWFFAEWPSFESQFDDFFNETEDGSWNQATVSNPTPSEENQEDENLSRLTSEQQGFVFFDVQAGMWKSKVFGCNFKLN